MTRAGLGLGAFLGLALVHSPASSHELWSNGLRVPEWVKHRCCGPNDAHHLASSQVHSLPDGWHLDGYPYVLPYGHELPSEDGDYWLFYRHPEYPLCFFTPAQTW